MVISKLTKKYTSRTLNILSRHPSHDVLRKKNTPVWAAQKAVIRLGSTSESKIPIQINTVEAVKTSSNKLQMKKAFQQAGLNSPEFWPIADMWKRFKEDPENIPFPLLAKQVYGSRGSGMKKLNNIDELRTFFNNAGNGYYFEKYHNYSREYRLHVTKFGCFYTCRKMLKSDTPDSQRWFRNDSNCVWYIEQNEKFNKPATWAQIEGQCMKGLKSVGLDIGAFDVIVAANGKFQLIEVNSAPSFGAGTEQEYRKVLPKLIADKALQN